MSRFAHIDILDNWPFASGARINTLRRVSGLKIKRAIGGEHRLTGTFSRTTPNASDMIPGRVLRVQMRDGAWSAWVLLEVNRNGSERDFIAGGIAAALAQCPPLTQVDAEGIGTLRFDLVGVTIAEVLSAYVLPAATAGGLTFVEAGTIEATARFDFTFNGTNPWAALQSLAQASGTEIDFETDTGTSKVKVHFRTMVNGSAAGVELRVGRNAKVTQNQSHTTRRTRIYGAGANGSTIGDAVWVVTNIASLVLTLADPAGGAGPLLRDDQLNGLYLEAANRTTRTAITDSVAGATQTVTVASATGFSVGDRVRVRKDSAGTRLLYLDDVANITSGRPFAGDPVLRDDIPETVNLVPNAAMNAYAGGSSAADGWSAVSTVTLTRTTTATFRKYGAYSTRCQTAGDGRGVATPLVTIAPSAGLPYVSGFIGFYLVSGAVRVELLLTDGVQTWIVPDGVGNRFATSTERGVFIAVGVAGIDAKALGATQARLRIVQHGTGSAEWYTDHAQITETAGQLPFVDGAGATQLWQAVNLALSTDGALRVRYDATALDLFRLDNTQFPYHELILGGYHRVVSTDDAIAESVRVLEIEEDVLTPADTAVVLSSRPEDLASYLAGPDAARLRSAVRSPPVVVPGARTVVDATTSGSATLGSATARFTSADIGRTVFVFGAAAGEKVLKTTITAVAGATSATMADAISYYVSGAVAIIGEAGDVATLAASIAADRAGSALIDADGSLAEGVKDTNGRDVTRFLGKASSGDSDSFDGLPDGSTYIKVIPFLTIKADQNSVSDTTVVVDIVVSDPSGGADPSISHNGGGAVTGSNPYTIARPAAGDGPLLVTFTASKTGRVSQSVPVQVPEQVGAGGTAYPAIGAFFENGLDTSAEEATFEWTGNNPPSGVTYDLRYWYTTTDAAGAVLDSGNGTLSAVTSPYDLSLSALNFDLKTKVPGTTGFMNLSLQLRMKDGGGGVVDTKDMAVTLDGDYQP